VGSETTTSGQNISGIFLQKNIKIEVLLSEYQSEYDDE